MTRTTAGEPRDPGPARRQSPVEREPVTPSPPTVSVPDWLYRRDRTIDGSQSGRYSPPQRQGRFRPIAKPTPTMIPPGQIRPGLSYRGRTYSPRLWTVPIQINRTGSGLPFRPCIYSWPFSSPPTLTDRKVLSLNSYQ